MKTFVLKTLFSGLSAIIFMITPVGQVVFGATCNMFSHPDSAYIFAYSPARSNGNNGLHIAWSVDKENWHAIGSNHSFVRSDYSRWGAEKRMINPYLFRDIDGLWHCVWTLNERVGAFAHAASRDLIYWIAQSYPLVMADGNCIMPVIARYGTDGKYAVAWNNDRDGTNQSFYATTKDFKTYAPTNATDANTFADMRREVFVA